MDLQTATQMGTTSGLDISLLIICAILVTMGILGGLANYFLRDRQNDGERNDWLKYPVLGVVAALTVPLFLI